MMSFPRMLPVALAALAVGACTSEKEASCDGLAGVAVTRVADHLGGGRELTARVRFADGTPVAGQDLSRCLSVRGGGSAKAAKRTVGESYTMLLVDPGASMRENEAARALALAVIAKRPGDRIAIWRWGAEVTQVAPFVTDPGLLAERLAGGLPVAAGLETAATAMTTAGAALSTVGGVGSDALRTLVIISPRAIDGLSAGAIGGAEPNLVVWMGPPAAQGSAEAIPASLRFATDAGAAAAATRLSDQLTSYRRDAFYGIGYCGDAREIEVRADGAATGATVALWPVLQENARGKCSAGRIVAGPRPFPKKLELIFTEAEQQAADAAYVARQKDKFPLSVRVSPDHQPVKAEGHFRGESSYTCVRRNYSINLDGKAPRFLFPGSASSKFHLVAMCIDRLYMRNFTAIQLMAEEGMFPVPVEMVELAINGQSQGVYLLMENVADSIRVHRSSVASVIRRYKRLDGPGTMPEVRWASLPDEAALQNYETILTGTQGLTGPRLEETLRGRLHVDQYLGWTALMTVIGSGDYVDEVFFYDAETTGPDGKRAPFYMVMGWDQDDMFSPCHFNGRFAIQDPAGLIPCSEAELDYRIFSDPTLYARYVDVLGWMIERMPPERFEMTLRRTVDRLLGFFRDPKILAAMIEMRRLNPDATSDPRVAQLLLETDAELLTAAFASQRALLLERIARLGK